MSDRSELLRNAIAFLSDPKAQDSSLAQRIQFLESKGLSSSEIEQAVREASASPPRITSPSVASYGPGYSTYAPSAYGFNQPHSIPQRDWRDYFIMAVVSGGIMTGAIALARKYLFPHLQPPSQTQYEADSSALDAQFDGIERRLNAMQVDCETTRQAAEAQRDRVAQLVIDVETAVKELKDDEMKSREELREIKEEVDAIREMLPKMLEKNKEGPSAALADLQLELKSLKTLILSSSARGLPNNLPSPSPPALASRPSIPAWQLSMHSSSTPANSESRSKEEETLGV